MDKDFRYTLPDGSEVEAFQVTDAALFQEKESPDWMDSKMLMTKGSADSVKAKHWLTIGELELEIPPYGWIVRDGAGNITVVDYSVMEGATKVVKEIPVIPPVALPMTDNALMLAAKVSKRPFEECKSEDQLNVEQANRNRQAIIDSLDPEDAERLGHEQTGGDEPTDLTMVAEVLTPNETVIDVVLPGGAALISETNTEYPLIEEVKEAFQACPRNTDCYVMLKETLSKRTRWCSCPPSFCDGERDVWECRANSPLVQA